MNTLEKERHRHHISVRFALEGIKIAFLTQPNFTYHTFFSALALLFGLFLKINQLEWAIIIFTIVVGFTIEMGNTAIEAVVDLVTETWHEDAKRAKDVAAGMMLIYAYGAVVIAAVVFVPHILPLIGL